MPHGQVPQIAHAWALASAAPPGAVLPPRGCAAAQALGVRGRPQGLQNEAEVSVVPEA